MYLNRNPRIVNVFSPPLQATRTTKKARTREEGTDEDNPPLVTYKETLVGDSQYREDGIGGRDAD